MLDCSRASIVRVDDRDARVRGHTLEQGGFGTPVILDRPVIIEMLARNVGHRGDVEAHMIQPVHRKPVRRRLQDCPRRRGINHLSQVPLDVAGLRGRLPGGMKLLAVADADGNRSHHAGLGAGGSQNVVDQVRCRRLAVRARDADDAELP